MVEDSRVGRRIAVEIAFRFAQMLQVLGRVTAQEGFHRHRIRGFPVETFILQTPQVFDGTKDAFRALGMAGGTVFGAAFIGDDDHPESKTNPGPTNKPLIAGEGR